MQVPWETMLRCLPYHPRWFEDAGRHAAGGPHPLEYGAVDAGAVRRVTRPRGTVIGGRYEVVEVLGAGAAGGTYRAVDTATGAHVVVREARSGVAIGPHRRDAAELLRHEHGLLAELAGAAGSGGPFVRPLGFFTAKEEGDGEDGEHPEEHAWLVEEFVAGQTLARFTAGCNPLANLELTPGPMADYYRRLRRLWLQIADAVAACHERGIVLGDLSPDGIIVTPDDRVRITGLASAFREGVDHGAGLFTPGTATRRAMAVGHGDRRGDHYALGGLMLSGVLGCQSGDVLEHALPLRLLDAVAHDIGLPGELVGLIGELYDEDAAVCGPAQLRRRLAELPFETAWRRPPPLAGRVGAEPGGNTELYARIGAVLDGVADYLVGTADPRREDRLFPADLMVFRTGPLSLAHGAYGCLYALHGLRGEVPGELLAWALARPAARQSTPPGLYYGSAGAAWALSALGQRDAAVRMLRQSADHPLLHAEPGVLTGAAGHGMACLRLWRDSGLPEFLERARAIGERLAAGAVWEEDRAHWPASCGPVPVGYGHGASGVAMFLLALHAATGDRRMLELGRAGLEFDLSCAVYSPAGVMSFPSHAAGDAPVVRRHHWDEGTAGVLTTLLRYWDATGEERLRKDLDRVLPDVRRKYTDSPQLFHGMSGVGNALLDAYEFLGDPELLGDAERTAEAVLLNALPRPEGTAFPGRRALRESADLATGAAGVTLFLRRLPHAAPGHRTNGNFLLDDLLTADTAPGTP